MLLFFGEDSGEDIYPVATKAASNNCTVVPTARMSKVLGGQGRASLVLQAAPLLRCPAAEGVFRKIALRPV